MHTLSRRTLLRHGLTGLGIATTPAVFAQPASPQVLRGLQLVVPTPAGTQPDLIARWLIEPLALQAGLTGTVINRPGAAGAIAADAVLAAPPESGTLLLGGLDHVAYSHVGNARRPLDPMRDFTPVGVVNRDTWVVVCGADSSLRRWSDLVEAARAGTKLHHASNGEGSTAHLLGARLCKRLGIEAQHVPYKESYLPDLMAGRISFALAPTPAMVGPLRGGRVRALASLTAERLPSLDGVPSIRELGFEDQVFHGGLFLFAPAPLMGHARDINHWLVTVLRTDEVQRRYREAAIEPTPWSLEQTRTTVSDRLRTVDDMRMAVFGRAR